MIRNRLAALLVAAFSIAPLAWGCGAVAVQTLISPATRSIAHPGKPPLALVAREGDPLGAFAAAVTTTQIDARNGDVAVALAALVEARLATRSLLDLAATPSIDGYRIRARAKTPADAAAGLNAIADALAAPVAEAEVAAVTKKIAALGSHRLIDSALVDVAACRGEPYQVDARTTPLDRATIERWRAAAHGRERVALAAVGTTELVRAADNALATAAAWADAAALHRDPWRRDADAHLYILPSDTTVNHPAFARVELAVRTQESARAVALAEQLGSSQGALVARLGALESPARVASVSATAHPNGGCVAVRIELSDLETREGGSSESARPRDVEIATRVAAVVSVATQEASVEAEDVAAGDDGAAIARRAGDARDAAESAAWWTLADSATAAAKASVASVASVAVGIAAGRDGGIPLEDRDARETQLTGRVRAEIDRASRAGAAPMAEVRSRVEHGQGETWALVASPCGTLDERTKDAGLAAAAVLAAAAASAAHDDGVQLEPWATTDGVGILAHAAARFGESPTAVARRVAGAAARGFAATPLDGVSLTRARAELLTVAVTPDARSIAALAEAIAPGHPAWFAPLGTSTSLGAASDASVLTRAAALRSGPVRVAILAGDDDAQITAAAKAVDRWMVHRDRGAMTNACAAPSTPPPSRPGTYAVDGSGPSQAWLALPLPSAPASSPNDPTAEWLVDALDGGSADGLLVHALEGAGLVRSASARILGPSWRPALAIRLDAPAGALDAAVAETRAALDRVRAGALDSATFARVAAHEKDRRDRQLATPRGRIEDIWTNGPSASASSAPSPTLASLRDFAAANLRDDALIIVVARPPAPTPAHATAKPTLTAPTAKPAAAPAGKKPAP